MKYLSVTKGKCQKNRKPLGKQEEEVRSSVPPIMSYGMIPLNNPSRRAGNKKPCPMETERVNTGALLHKSMKKIRLTTKWYRIISFWGAHLARGEIHCRGRGGGEGRKKGMFYLL